MELSQTRKCLVRSPRNLSVPAGRRIPACHPNSSTAGLFSPPNLESAGMRAGFLFLFTIFEFMKKAGVWCFVYLNQGQRRDAPNIQGHWCLVLHVGSVPWKLSVEC